MKAVNIQWDTDGDEEALASLPTEVEIPETITEDDDAISDWLSDQFGFCHFGFAIQGQRYNAHSCTEWSILKGENHEHSRNNRLS